MMPYGLSLTPQRHPGVVHRGLVCRLRWSLAARLQIAVRSVAENVKGCIYIR